jgi:hypothetical protein
MSNFRVFVAVLLAVLLSGAALLLLRGGGEADDAAIGLAFDPARVVELATIYPAEGTRAERSERIVRGPGGGWDVRWTDAGGEASWPAAPAQVRAGLRILSTLEGRPAERSSRLEHPAVELRITLQGEREEPAGMRLLRLSGRPLAGRVLAELGSPEALRTAWVDKSILDMLGTGSVEATAGPRAWRDHSALPGVGAEVSRVLLQGSAGTLSLARVQGRWALREPVAEFAEPESVSRLFAALAQVRIMDFLDSGRSPERTGLGPEDEPVALLVLETDLRDATLAGAPAPVLQRTLAAGQTADIAGRSIFARVREEVLGGPDDRQGPRFDRIMVVSAETLAGIAMDPAAYISRRSLQIPEGDIGFLTLLRDGSERSLRRTLDGWRESGRESVPLDRADAESLKALLALLTQSQAARVLLGDASEEGLSVRVTTLAGDPAGEFVLHIHDEAGSISVWSRGVKREHELRGLEALAHWMR